MQRRLWHRQSWIYLNAVSTPTYETPRKSFGSVDVISDCGFYRSSGWCLADTKINKIPSWRANLEELEVANDGRFRHSSVLDRCPMACR